MEPLHDKRFHLLQARFFHNCRVDTLGMLVPRLDNLFEQFNGRKTVLCRPGCRRTASKRRNTDEADEEKDTSNSGIHDQHHDDSDKRDDSLSVTSISKNNPHQINDKRVNKRMMQLAGLVDKESRFQRKVAARQLLGRAVSSTDLTTGTVFNMRNSSSCAADGGPLLVERVRGLGLFLQRESLNATDLRRQTTPITGTTTPMGQSVVQGTTGTRTGSIVDGTTPTFSPPTYATMVAHLPRTSFPVHPPTYFSDVSPTISTYLRSVSHV